MDLIFFIAIVFGWIWYKRAKSLFTIPPEKAFDAYVKAHPDCVKDGQIRCCNCGGRQIWFRLYAADVSRQINAHVCKSCGVELYRSITML